ncbi:MAG: hypothetical protein BWY74_00712 [Firmicutes bacterium ADurb.Bin419]|nr:MAG: hypothetical protein BWY74_00712 [Firmicutes bacterium ADurb.Bin419]
MLIVPILPDPVVLMLPTLPVTVIPALLPTPAVTLTSVAVAARIGFAFPPTLTVPAEPIIIGEELPIIDIFPPLASMFPVGPFTVIFAFPIALTKPTSALSSVSISALSVDISSIFALDESAVMVVLDLASSFSSLVSPLRLIVASPPSVVTFVAFVLSSSSSELVFISGTSAFFIVKGCVASTLETLPVAF